MRASDLLVRNSANRQGESTENAERSSEAALTNIRHIPDNVLTYISVERTTNYST